MLITFEGIDFCGKSTQIKLLEKYLVNNKIETKIIREPGGTEISELIRDILLDKKNNLMFMETEILLFSASRSQLVREKIKPFIEKNYYVICDRFFDSTTAYQGYGRGISPSAVESVNKLAVGELIPDLTFFIDISIEEANNRKQKMNGDSLDRIENSNNEFFIKVRNGYLEIAKREKRFRIINGENSVENIHQQIINEIEIFKKG